MPQSLEEAIRQLQITANAIAGVVEAPQHPPEAANQFPFAVTYPARGEFPGGSAGWTPALHTVFTEFHYSRQSLPAAVDAALPMAEDFVQELIDDPTINASVETVVFPVPYTFGRLEWAGVETLGWRFEVTLKIIVTT